MKPRPLTPAQRLALLQLHVRWRWGIDERTARGLRIRGLVRSETTLIADRAFARVASVDLPWLTEAGRREAARLWLELPVEQKAAVREELAKWGL